jgi:hypothetical protein
MSYRLLVLPPSETMTPRLLRKISDLVKGGATIVGSRPQRSPSLSDYPKCDEDVKRLSDELWGDCDGVKVKERRFGLGRVLCGISPEDILAQSGAGPDFGSRENLRYIHRTAGTTDIYFVSNPRPYAVTAMAGFRVTGKSPELWWPDTGRTEQAAMFQEKAGVTSVMLPLGPSGSVFVVFRKTAKSNPVLAVEYNGKSVLSLAAKPAPKIVVRKAMYGVLDDPTRTRDVQDKVQRLADGGDFSFEVARMAAGDDPAYGIVKTLIIEYTVDGKPATTTGTDPETVNLAATPGSSPPCELTSSGARLTLIARLPGQYTLVRAAGTKQVTVSDLPAALKIAGPWAALFPPNQGAPERIKLDRLASLSEHPDPGVKYFSGTATYRATFDLPKSFLAGGRTVSLDLGDVQVIAEVKLNGRNLGILWKPPFTVNVRNALKPAGNEIEVKVTNLWPNRMIGDEQLAEDSDRNPNGTLKSWPKWLQEGKPSPTGRYTFTSWRMWGKNEALLSSGLIGPVTLSVAREITIE